MNKSKPLIFCDFDGTIAVDDVGYQLFHHFSGRRNDELMPDWKSGRMSNREVLVKEAAMVTANPEEIIAFIDKMKLDPTFAPFVKLCQKNNIKPVVLSEGLDFYIEHLLKKNSLDHLPMLANHGIMENKTIRIEFPYKNQNCTRCGCCKGERIDEYRAEADDGAVVVFVGDGYSDTCGAERADIIMAKKDLANYCRDKNIDFVPFDTFEDVGRFLLNESILFQ